ncbi:unnamed protein product [Orchesella dallaii]|uniref:Calcium release-activated calcium channel protein 1 n=1 Tax=Orchesella dallaii TaxID=48710 RepID=A0ABP1QT88_9HEXA
MSGKGNTPSNLNLASALYYENYAYAPSLASIPAQAQDEGYNMNGDGQHSAATLLSWRKLHLSRAKLKAINKTSALMSGFAMVAMVEMQLNEDTKVPSELLVAFVICTSLLVAVHMLALMISTCILPNVEAISNLHNINIVEESPHERMHWYIEAGWAFSTVLGIFLFLCELAILCWVKFYDYSMMAASSATIIMVPVLILFIVFAIHFYHKLVVHKYELTETGLRELEQLKQQLDSTGSPLNNSSTPPRGVQIV